MQALASPDLAQDDTAGAHRDGGLRSGKATGLYPTEDVRSTRWRRVTEAMQAEFARE
jgi:hypothetical protein